MKNDLLKIVSTDLKLNFEPQDWGIINASSHRVAEFIHYFEANTSLPESIKYQLFELIIASFNDSILENGVTKEQEHYFKQFIHKYSQDSIFKPILNYWKNIENEDFPVGKLL